MKSPKMRGPSPEELEATRLQNEALAKRNVELDLEQKKKKADEADATAALAGNRVGVRSLLSNDWAGFDRTGGFGGAGSGRA